MILQVGLSFGRIRERDREREREGGEGKTKGMGDEERVPERVLARNMERGWEG